MNKRFLHYILLFVFALACHGYVSAKAVIVPEKLSSQYNKWMDVRTADLVGKGREFLYQRNSPDSALVCFSIAISRYNENLSDDEKQEIFKAYIGRWFAQFFHYYDYPKAYESLLEALKISNETGHGRGMVNLNLAMMYQMFGTDGKDKSAIKNARDYSLKAFKEAIAEKDSNVVHMAFSNMVSLMEDDAQLRGLAPYKKQYEDFSRTSRHPIISFNLLLCEINQAIVDKKYDKALSLIDRQREFVTAEQPRYLISNLMSRAKVKMLQGEYASAESLLKDAEEIAAKTNMKDVLLNVYDERRGIFHHSGDAAKEAEAYHAYLCMKDTLLNYRQISGFSELNFLSDIEKLDRTLAQAQYKRKVQARIMVFCVFVIVCLMVLVFVIWKKNRKLHSANLSLYEKTRERIIMEGKNEQLLVSESILSGKEEKSADNVSGTVDNAKREKMLARIYSVAASSDEIFSPKFTISKFAELAELPQKQVSQLINESTGDNFNGFINKYRIKKACCMLDDIETYGSYTIENIGVNVGFRSRTTFIAAFKKFTGLNPSDYLKAAKQSRQQKN